jgi:hypothetical protein
MDKYPKGHLLCADHGYYEHVGISDGKGCVYENAYRTGGRGKVSLEDFSGGKKIIDIGILPGSSEPNIIIKNAERAISDKKKYNVLFNNCEHFVREVCGVDIKSPQIQQAIFSAVSAAVALKVKDPGLKGATVGAALGTVLSKGSKSVLKNSLIGASFGLIVGLAVKFGKDQFEKHSFDKNKKIK